MSETCQTQTWCQALVSDDLVGATVLSIHLLKSGQLPLLDCRLFMSFIQFTCNLRAEFRK